MQAIMVYCIQTCFPHCSDMHHFFRYKFSNIKKTHRDLTIYHTNSKRYSYIHLITLDIIWDNCSGILQYDVPTHISELLLIWLFFQVNIKQLVCTNKHPDGFYLRAREPHPTHRALFHSWKLEETRRLREKKGRKYQQRRSKRQCRRNKHARKDADMMKFMK